MVVPAVQHAAFKYMCPAWQDATKAKGKATAKNKHQVGPRTAFALQPKPAQ
jgi:hypothetical protein